jgi:hypothetical protein
MTLKMRAQRPIKSRHALGDKRSKTADRYVAFHAGSGRTSTKDMGLSAVKSYSIVLNRNGVALKHRPLRTLVVSTAFASAFATLLAGCVTHGQGQLAVNPNIGVAIAPPPVLVVAPPVYEEAYVPGPNDQYIVNVTDANIVVFGGNTYIWVVGHDGVRRRRFYAHGDHRAEIFHRRDELHTIAMHHGGRLPDHRIEAHASGVRPGMSGGRVAAAAQPSVGGKPAQGVRPGGAPVSHAATASKAAANRDTKKS